MQQIRLTEETSVSIPPNFAPTISPALSPEQAEPISGEGNTDTLTDIIQTEVEPELTQSEPLLASTPTSQEFQTQFKTVSLTLAKFQRQWQINKGLNIAFYNVKFNAVNFTLWGLLVHISHEYLLANLRAVVPNGSLTDYSVYFLWPALVVFLLTPVFGSLKKGAQRKLDDLTQTIAQFDDRRAIGPLCRALVVRSQEVRSVVIRALHRLLPLQSDDPGAVGPLTDILIWLEPLFCYDILLRAELIATLERLIPRMTREDADFLNVNQRKQLNLYLARSQFTLREGDDPFSPALTFKYFTGRRKISLRSDEKELTLAILRAYPVIGDGTELPYVRAVAQGKGNAGTDADVRQAAQQYLDLVAARKQQEKLSTTLLRASSASEASSDTLLRPTDGTFATDPDELLRVATVEAGSK